MVWRIFHCLLAKKLYFCLANAKNRQTMSEATLTNLLEYLYETLTPSDKRWVGERLIKYANYEEEPVKPYTMEEINARIDQSERDSAEGKVYDFDDVMREIEEEFAFEEKLEMAEAV